MHSSALFKDSCEIALKAVSDGRLDRRAFLRACALLGLTPSFLASRQLYAAPTQIVHANWGGDAVACVENHYGKPFTDATGLKVVVDGSGPLESKIISMVKAGKVIWDCCDEDAFNGLRLGKQNMAEPIDYAIVDKNKVLPDTSWEYGVCGYWYSYVLAYDSSKFGDNPPKSWTDFWNLKDFPGKRSMWKWMNGNLEAAVMAAGVPMDKVYPVDLPLALQKINEIKPETIYWDSGAESQQMLLTGEVSMALIWQTRAATVERESQGRVKWTWNQGIAAPAAWVVPKGNPAGREAAMRWIASMQDPAQQIEILKCFGQGPANPEAAAALPPELRRIHPAAPENFKQQLPFGNDWYANNYDSALQSFTDMISE